ncbi:MAG: hydroxyacylglutathione hydrolase [Candidatus Wenzhouxiangella sp. M2_3B_020]
MTIEVEAIRAFSDNYIWALHDSRRCVIVDPGDARPALDFLADRGLELVGLLLTHHHHDHVGGVDEMRASHPAPAWGPADRRMPGDLEVVGEGDRVRIEPLGLAFDVLETPGHTTSHIAFAGHGMLFCGDTLFSAGCGKLFEGDPPQMQDSLDKLASLPDGTRVYCAHEYTESNCRFARRVEPDNAALERRCEQVRELRSADRITLPSTIGDEKSYNPFLRTRETDVVRAARQRDPEAGASAAEVLGVIRAWKDAS